MSAPSKILVVALDNLGDVVMATSVLGPLRRAFPSATLGFFGKRYAEGLLDGHPFLDRVHAADPFWDRSPGHPPGGVGAYLRAVGGIRRERYDAALLLNTEWRRAASALLAGIPRRVGFARRHASVFLSDAVAAPARPAHFVDEHRRLVETLAPGASTAEFQPALGVTPGDMAAAEAWLREAGWRDKSYVAIHPFSGDERKNWPLERWRDLAGRLGRPLAVFCSRAESERLAAWKADAGADARFVAGEPLGVVKGLLARAALLIGGDSGPGHVASALGTPVVSLFGPGDPGRSGPRGAGAVAVVKADPLAGLAVEAVEKAAASLLSPEAAR